ncbi:MAG: hypothetical protein E6I28_14350, partial [Chloroflexi bacterium]
MSNSRRLELTTAREQSEVMARLSSRVRSARVMSALTGDWSQGEGVVGSISERGFDLRRKRFVANPYAVHAFGTIRRNALTTIVVEFRRTHLATWVLRILRALGILIVGGALVAALRQPIFLTFAAFAATGMAVLFWGWRERAEDRVILRRFLTDTFPDATTS